MFPNQSTHSNRGNASTASVASTTISAKEYRERRNRFAGLIGENGIAIIPGAQDILRNSDVHHLFRQDSDFRYLCNFPEADAVLVLRGGATAHCVLFCRPRDALRELWEGARVGVEGALDYSGVDESFDLHAMDERVPRMLAGLDAVYCQADANSWLHKRLDTWMRGLRAGARSGMRAPHSVISLSDTLHEMRLFKSVAELEIMGVAGRVAIDAHARAMAECTASGWEHQLEAALYYEFIRRGARHWAYPPIVAGASNACVLHYTNNDAALQAGSMVLIDAGCEVAGYASDISRSFPVDGSFSSEQAALYDVVLAAQQAAIDSIMPGKRFEDAHSAALAELVKGMVDLGILKGKPSALIRDESWRRYFPHRIGHWLGLDVHDVGSYKEKDGSSRILAEGMVMTVEPGLYIPASDTKVASHWRGLGVRIEDDIVVREAGAQYVNPNKLRGRDEIQTLMERSQ